MREVQPCVLSAKSRVYPQPGGAPFGPPCSGCRGGLARLRIEARGCDRRDALEVFRARAASSESSSLIRVSSRSEFVHAKRPAERESWTSQNPNPLLEGRESPRRGGHSARGA